ncbi:hypothetical protein SVI_3052 [Shewanella violacea DSS12]|uniref:Uncharacterized protein n=1 Tax=Shewanella violacea (strain JCM 10179 / CIP 106290 / LMG 19151 / DSS12) TaxID=637905 RepID=D4ZAH8_SHEVD|nr:hypothetical protein SVI_3052 [Shewanella violacea DSS12]
MINPLNSSAIGLGMLKTSIHFIAMKVENLARNTLEQIILNNPAPYSD